jgi:hypothetical protein
MESIYMKSRFVSDQFARRFATRALGVSMVAGLALAAAAPAQADVYNSWGGVIPYIYNQGEGVQDTWIPGFSIQAKPHDRGWFSGSGTTDASGTGALVGIRLGQMVASPRICIQVSKPGAGWLQEQCTTGVGSQIEVGGGTTLPIEAVSLRLLDCQANDNLSANAFVVYTNGTPYVPARPATYKPGPDMVCSFIGAMPRWCPGPDVIDQPAVPEQPAVPGRATWQQQDDAVPYSTSLNPFYTANTCGQRLTLGVQGGGGMPRIDALNLKIKRSDCSGCTS